MVIAVLFYELHLPSEIRIYRYNLRFVGKHLLTFKPNKIFTKNALKFVICIQFAYLNEQYVICPNLKLVSTNTYPDSGSTYLNQFEMTIFNTAKTIS